jgi:alginate O-acetyltransferase complex protein AlgI
MIFTSPAFIFVFLPLCCLLVGLGRLWGTARFALWILALSSLAFYSVWQPINVLILMGSILVNYWISALYSKSRFPKALLTSALLLNLGLLFYFKYAAFASSVAVQLGFMNTAWLAKVLPLGLSFITFQKIAFQVDRYRGIAPHPKFSHFLSFVTFFPQLIAGPIVHHQEFIPQLPGWHPRASLAGEGCFLFAIGAAKKAVLADSLAPLATEAFANPASLDCPTAWAALIAYTFQLYFDFSGYSDMAVGLGLMFGIRLPWNFNSPYKSASLIDFWRNWHMTLSRFLKDYVYIPLGGSHCSPWRRKGNLLLTMLAGGIWHGAGWTYVLWGGLHGSALVVAHAVRRKGWNVPIILGWLGTMVVVMAGWVLFRSATLAESLTFFQRLGAVGSPSSANILVAPTIPYIIVAGVVAFAGRNTLQLSARFSPTAGRAIWTVSLIFLAVLMMLSRVEPPAFLYFDF